MGSPKPAKRSPRTPPIDRTALLAWLRSHADHPDVIVYAVLTGLTSRIERGDFDEKEAA